MTLDLKGRVAIVTGAGNFEAAHITLTQGVWPGRDGEIVPDSGTAQGQLELSKAMRRQ